MSLDAAAQAQLDQGRYATAYLVDLHFAGGILRLATVPLARVHANGAEYSGLGAGLSVAPITFSEDGRAETIKLTLGLKDDAPLALVLGDVAGYRGRRVRIWLQVFDTAFRAQGEPELEWQGFMEPVRVRHAKVEKGTRREVEMPCSRAGLARSRNAHGLRVTDAQHQQIYPGDLFCEYLGSLLEQPITWLSKRFQEVEA